MRRRFGGLLCSGANQVQADLRSGGDSFVNNASLPTFVFTGAGDDVLVTGSQPGPSQTTFIGGDGRDVVDYAGATRGVTVTDDNEANDGRSGSDRDNIGPDVERIIGSNFADAITGGAGPERIHGRGGDDALNGGGGIDVFVMESVADGADRIFGGDGFDTVEYFSRTRAVTVNLSDGGADDGEAAKATRSAKSSRPLPVPATTRSRPTRLRLPACCRFRPGRGHDHRDERQRHDHDRPGHRSRGRPRRDDFVGSRDNEADTIACGPGVDTVDSDVGREIMSGCEKAQPVGELALAPAALRAEAGKPAPVRLSWSHPRAWSRLRTIELRLMHGNVPVGAVRIRPQRGTAHHLG
jgi:hypothetical protein